MKSERMVTSAALYFKSELRRSIPLSWFENAREFFAQYNLSPILFTADGNGFLLDDCYVVAERGQDFFMFGEVIHGRRFELVNALRNGEIESLGLDSPYLGANDREEWRATVSVFLKEGKCYVGIDQNLVSDPVTLLRHTYEITSGLFDVRYGIAYKMPLAQHPDCFASGFVSHSVAEVIDMIRHRDHWDQRKKTPDELWSGELSGERRHLTGLFRGAYPANVLSESHIRSAALRSRGVGKLTELGESLCLWELADSEIPEAERLLESRGVLVRQVVKA